MGKVTPIRRKGAGGPPTAGAHIDTAAGGRMPVQNGASLDLPLTILDRNS